MKRYLIGISIVLALVLMFYGIIYLNNIAVDNAYNDAISLIKDGLYEKSLEMLERVNPSSIDREDFKSDVRKGYLYEAYKDSIPLYAFAMAQVEYNSEERYMHNVNEYLELIPKDYSGDLSAEIKTFRENFKTQYDKFLEEEKRKDEELRLRLEEIERDYYADLRTKIPYVGMSESDINSTIMGTYHEYEHVVVGKGKRTEFDKNEYRWKNNNGKTILFVECQDGVVEYVIKYGENIYWTADGKPIFSGYRSGYSSSSSSSSSSKKKVYNGDDYDVNDYYDAEDFYEDHYDDFYDYYDAEDYFDEYHD